MQNIRKAKQNTLPDGVGFHRLPSGASQDS